MIIHSLQHLHGGVTSLTTPDLPGELPPALWEATAHIRKVGLGVSRHPTSPSCHLLPALPGDLDKGAHPIPATEARKRASGQGHAGTLKTRALSTEMLSQPAASLHARRACHGKDQKSPSTESLEDEQADGLSSRRAGVRLIPSPSPLPSPVAHHRRVTPAGKQGIISRHAFPAPHPSRGIIHLWHFRKDTLTSAERGQLSHVNNFFLLLAGLQRS